MRHGMRYGISSSRSLPTVKLSAFCGLDVKDFKMHRSGDPLGPNAHRSHVFESLGVWTVDLVVLARLDGRASRIIPVVSKARQGVTVFT